jgi:hypothetical protein
VIPDLHRLKRYIFGREVQVDIPARVQAYRIALTSPSSKQHIMPDILEFTGVLSPAPVRASEFEQGRAQGRRDVGLHILENLTLTPIELYAILRGQPIIKPEDFQHG